MGIFDRLRKPRHRADVPHASTPVEGQFDVSTSGSDAEWVLRGMTFEELEQGGAPPNVENRYIVLSMLAEGGDAERQDNRFVMSVDQVARVSDAVAAELGLPGFYAGAFETTIQANSTSPHFGVRLRPLRRERPEQYQRIGAIMTIRDEPYRLTPSMLSALTAVEAFNEVAPEDRDHDVDNVRVIAELQDAIRASKRFQPNDLDMIHHGKDSDSVPALDLDLEHFKNFSTFRPEKVGLSVEQQSDGSLRLLPHLDTQQDPDSIVRATQRVDMERDSVVLRDGNELTVLDEASQEGVREVLRAGHIPAHQVADFLESPGSFIDLEKVSLDLNFSVRVRGIGAFVPISLTDLASRGLHWIEDVEDILEPEALIDLAQDEEALTSVEEAVALAQAGDSDIAAVEEHLVDVSDADRVERALRRARQRLVAEQDATEAEPDEKKIQIGIHLHEVEALGSRLRRQASEARLAQSIDVSGLARRPYPHQIQGIEWMTRLMGASLSGELDAPDRIQGAILADDMGLGKTFMALAALDEFSRMQSHSTGQVAPTLVVVPLTLVENWEDEIASTLQRSPFTDVVVLQSNRDLNAYRRPGRGRESQIGISKLDSQGMLMNDAVEFSLVVGNDPDFEPLDAPGRLVITTYETLASYQLSLAQVEWGAVIFDEAQRIKNPETLVARAAKALKARFKLITTGTPVENSLKDLWNLLDTAQPGLLGTWTEFKNEWSRPIENGSPEEQLDRGRALAEYIKPFMLRRNKEDHLPNLPSKTVHSGLPSEGLQHDASLHRHMPSLQSEAYLQIMARHQTRQKTKGGALKTLQSLRNISLHPLTLNGTSPADGGPEAGARLTSTFEILDRIRALQEKAIVFVMDKAVQRALARWLHERYGIHTHIVNGETKAMSTRNTASRRQLVNHFQHRPGFGVIIMSPLAAGTGLTVTGANHAIHLERHWNPAKEAQATDRIYRIGQTKDVHVYLPMAIHPDPAVPSFDVNLHHLLQQKSDLKDAVVVPEVNQNDLARSMGIS